MTVLLEIVDDDHLTRLNRYQKPPRRGWALRGGALYKDGVLIGALTPTRANAGLSYVMKPRSTNLVVELRYTPIRELLNGEAT
jgi:hypothetical protein